MIFSTQHNMLALSGESQPSCDNRLIVYNMLHCTYHNVRSNFTCTLTFFYSPSMLSISTSITYTLCIQCHNTYITEESIPEILTLQSKLAKRAKNAPFQQTLHSREDVNTFFNHAHPPTHKSEVPRIS